MWDKFDSLSFGVGVSAMTSLSSVASTSKLSPRSPHSSPCGRHSLMFHSVNRSFISWITRRKRSCDLAWASIGGVPSSEAPLDCQSLACVPHQQVRCVVWQLMACGVSFFIIPLEVYRTPLTPFFLCQKCANMPTSTQQAARHYFPFIGPFAH